MSHDEIRDRAAAGLRERRIDVEIAETVDDAPSGPERPDVVVVELGLSAADGTQLCARLREEGMPGLIAIGDQCRVAAADVLRAGADDFMAQPAAAIELIARVRALLRRLKEYCAASAAIVDHGEVTLRCDRHEALVRGEKISLTPKEFDLLLELARSGGDLVEREELLERVWGYGDEVSSRTLDVHVGRLRKKIERDPSSPRLILTVPRVGYRMAA
jgi:DNA-binding response OmpR family regulator